MWLFDSRYGVKSMAAIIDILDVEQDDCPSFVVDNTQDYIEAAHSASGDAGYLKSAFNTGTGPFKQGDNITILSFGVRIPYGFEMYNEPSSASSGESYLTWDIKEKTSGTVHSLSPGATKLEFLNYEMSYGRFFDVSDSAEDFWLVTKLNNASRPLRISMLNVPDSLNGVTIYVRPFAKVSHTEVL